MKRALDLLRLRLALRALEDVRRSELHPIVLAEAHMTAALVADTGCPLLLFPCLFEERVAAALEREALETKLYWGRLLGGPLALTPG